MRCSSGTTSRDSERTGLGRGPGHAATDQDRRRTQDLLGMAVGSGHLDVHDLDVRLGQVWASATLGELERLEGAVPDHVRQEAARRRRALQQREAARAGLRGHVLTYVAVMFLLICIWLAAGLTSADWYPWPLWPAAFWGMSILGQARAARLAVP